MKKSLIQKAARHLISAKDDVLKVRDDAQVIFNQRSEKWRLSDNGEEYLDHISVLKEVTDDVDHCIHQLEEIVNI